MSVARRSSGPLALVYRGKASSPGCPEAVATLLRSSTWGFDVRYVGEREEYRLCPNALEKAVLYAHPGGGSFAPAWRRMRKHRATLRSFVRAGGRYLGFCLGAYLAGATPGLELFPGDTDQYIRTSHATVTDALPHLINVSWLGNVIPMYFQDGPTLIAGPDAEGIEILGRYLNHEIAALAAPCGSGRVALVGPHPEATLEWFTDDHLPTAPGTANQAGLELVNAAMRNYVASEP
jgi:glutamine amidotransferase-like uncharacterized protein